MNKTLIVTLTIIIIGLFLSVCYISLTIEKQTVILTKEIEKHSVHPKFGKYTEVNAQTNVKCNPWDACEETD
jgi:hypothetical protein